MHALAGVRTTVILGSPAVSCAGELPESPAGAAHFAGHPLYVPAELASPDHRNKGTFGAYATQNDTGQLVAVTAAHVLMTRDERLAFDDDPRVVLAGYQNSDIHHPAPGLGRPVVGQRLLDPGALTAGNIDAALVTGIPDSWQAVEADRHILPGFAFDEVDPDDCPAELRLAEQGWTQYGCPKLDWCASGLALSGVVPPESLWPDSQDAEVPTLISVAKRGKKTGLTFGLACPASHIRVDDEKWPFSGGSTTTVMAMQVAIQPWEVNSIFCDSGDSGAAVWLASEPHGIVGILHKMFPTDGGRWGIVCPATFVENALNISFCVGEVGEDRRVLSSVE